MKKNDWPIFGCKVRQSALIVMKLELDVCHRLLDECTRFEIDILKHIQTLRKTFRWWGFFTIFVYNYPCVSETDVQGKSKMSHKSPAANNIATKKNKAQQRMYIK